MKKGYFVGVFFMATLLLIGAGCTPIDSGGDEQKTTQTVVNYMNGTLGSIPTSDLNYDKAKEYLVPELQAQFENPMFVPASYCIQDGPDDVRATQLESSSSGATVRVRALYGGDWKEMWDFELVKSSGEWLIRDIICLSL